MDLHSLDEQNQVIDTFSSSTLPDLLTSNGLTLTEIFPQPNVPTQEWNADTVIDSLQAVFERATPRETVSPGTLQVKPVASLSDADKAVIATQSHRDFTWNDKACVEFVAPVVIAAAPVPAGLDDLARLLVVLKQARNQGLQLEIIQP